MAAIQTARLTALLSLSISLATSACVDPFGGSNIQFTLAGGVQVPGTPADFGRPPPGTHYEFHAVEHVTETDEDGNETVVSTFTYELANFEVRPVLDLSSPCFIENDDSRFPGLHATMYAAKLREETGVTDPFKPPDGADPGDVIDVLTADVRVANMAKLANGIKAIVSHDPAAYPSDFPPITDMSDAANAERRTRCHEFWAAHPLAYEGFDKVLTLPLNGKWYGTVDGADPRNGQFVGGAGFYVDAALASIDGLQLNWQYNCDPDDYLRDGIKCTPAYPASVPDDQRTDLGVHYMAGTAVKQVRGVINIPMRNRVFRQLTGEAAVWFDLSTDDVQF